MEVVITQVTIVKAEKTCYERRHNICTSNCKHCEIIIGRILTYNNLPIFTLCLYESSIDSIFLLLLIPDQCLSQGIEFSNLSWNELKREARDRKQRYFFYMHIVPYCRYSQEMEDSSFTHEVVADFYNTNFLNYQVNLEDSIYGYAVAEEYGIIGFPTYLYFNSNGELVHQSGGYQTSARFVSEGQRALHPDSGFYAMKCRYEAGGPFTGFAL